MCNSFTWPQIFKGELFRENCLKNILQAIILVPWEYINDTIMFRYYCSDVLELLIQHVRLHGKEKSYCLSDLEAEAPLNSIDLKILFYQVTQTQMIWLLDTE